MMQGETYIRAKQRMLLVADVADLMLRTPDKLRFDEKTYRVVAEALAWNRDDVHAMFAEMDMLRASLGLPIVPERSAPDGGAVSDGTVGVVQEPQDEGGGGEVQHHGAADGGPVQSSGSDGKRTKRPKSRRHKKGNAGTTAGVDSGNASEPVGGSEGEAAGVSP